MLSNNFYLLYYQRVQIYQKKIEILTIFYNFFNKNVIPDDFVSVLTHFF